MAHEHRLGAVYAINDQVRRDQLGVDTGRGAAISVLDQTYEAVVNGCASETASDIVAHALATYGLKSNDAANQHTTDAASLQAMDAADLHMSRDRVEQLRAEHLDALEFFARTVLPHRYVRLLPREGDPESDVPPAQEASVRDRVLKITNIIAQQGCLLMSMGILATPPAAIADARNRVPPDAAFLNATARVADARALTDTQLMYRLALLKLATRAARRKGDMVMVPLFSEGRCTTAYKDLCTIDAFVKIELLKGEQDAVTRIATSSPQLMDTVAKFLRELYSPMFPDLETDRYLMAFSNGTYNVYDRTFTPYADETQQTHGHQLNEDELMAALYAYGPEYYIREVRRNDMIARMHQIINVGPALRPELSAEERVRELGEFVSVGDIPPHAKAACVYHDVAFTDRSGMDFWDIPTPTLDKILHDQGINRQGVPDKHGKLPDGDVEETGTPRMQMLTTWIWALLGRYLYKIGELDEWEIMLLLLGRAGTGKSTLAKLVYSFFDPSDVGVVGNNVEVTFGLEALIGKLVIIMFEVRSNLKLDQAVWQSMISGETAPAARKNKTALNIVWTAHWLACANELPNFANASGAFTRRVASFEFTHPVEQDTSMFRKLGMELPDIIQKFNEAYRAVCQHIGSAGFWRCCPKYFHRQREQNVNASDTLRAFLSSQSVQINPQDPSFIVSFVEFTNAYKQHCRGGRPAVNMAVVANYDEAFNHYGLVVDPEPVVETDENGELSAPLIWIRGCRLVRVSPSLGTGRGGARRG